MAELNPPLGTTTPEIFLDNVKRADELVNGPAGTVNDRGGEPLDTWRQMMAKNDEIRQNLIPLSKQYATLAAAQTDIVNIPVNSTTYVRSPDGSALADEYMNVAGTLTATGRRMPSQQSVDESHKNILGYLTDALPNLYRFKTVHCQTAPTAQAASVAASWFILPDALTAGLISKVELAVATAGKIYVATFSKAGNVFTRKKVKSFDVAAGTVSLTPEMLADEGDYIGVYTEGGLYFNTAATITGTVYRWASTTPGSDTNFDTALATGSYNYTFQVRVTALRGNALSISTDALNTQLIGMASRFDNLSAPSRAGDGNRMFMLNTPVKFDGVVTGVTWLANNSGGAARQSGRWLIACPGLLIRWSILR